ncbi:hypothetical protein ANAPC1_01417 [Anaplasma phagocytophilum]|uniref:Uncharacterized protein n=1 Tax=Anaplasma phagocytophilum TaxID=948 RepID=A0AA45UUB9_ANAPH|nr:hypothetical protein [Anaplasma phagocytophilum]SBO15039.1 hypothetical protein ANAPC1_01417 [Anaplasma phagocytophilum]SBO33510.1 hypothetical protein ANAPC2_01377 [Anaplasma phagocytophilum]SBO33784.1 hypothetical protein ANAPC3_01353 [Anaplasma phagocytophilum]SBO33929.1 hypothetical protein ANAPC4_01369 [Anaplasma phagocytophilum]SCV61677.1 hypothetical protein ANAPC5_00049 [Anaplasma phagocytophilum]
MYRSCPFVTEYSSSFRTVTMPLERHSLPSGVAATTLLCNLYDYAVDIHDVSA